MPKTCSFLMVSPKEMHVRGKLRTKLAVPSIGSMIHVGSSVSWDMWFLAEDSSSPINLRFFFNLKKFQKSKTNLPVIREFFFDSSNQYFLYFSVVNRYNIEDFLFGFDFYIFGF